LKDNYNTPKAEYQQLLHYNFAEISANIKLKRLSLQNHTITFTKIPQNYTFDSLHTSRVARHARYFYAKNGGIICLPPA